MPKQMCLLMVENKTTVFSTNYELIHNVLPDLRTLDPPLSPPLTQAEIFGADLFFCELKPDAKFRNPMITPSVRKVSREKKKKERKRKKLC